MERNKRVGVSDVMISLDSLVEEIWSEKKKFGLRKSSRNY